MITKDQLAASMLRDCDISLHLFGKLTPEAWDYRPSPSQRSTTELLQYLSICGAAGIRCMSQNDWKLFGEYSDRAKAMSPGEFPKAMERQKDEIAAFFLSVSESTLESFDAPLPGGGTLPLALAILNGPQKWLNAYKLQLFLYVKSACDHAVSTPNLWAGVDRR
ncbi:MAG: hypothetical protein ABI613_02700 [Gemmatimonadota bacterium]